MRQEPGEEGCKNKVHNYGFAFSNCSFISDISRSTPCSFLLTFISNSISCHKINLHRKYMFLIIHFPLSLFLLWTVVSSIISYNDNKYTIYLPIWYLMGFIASSWLFIIQYAMVSMSKRCFQILLHNWPSKDHKHVLNYFKTFNNPSRSWSSIADIKI